MNKEHPKRTNRERANDVPDDERADGIHDFTYNY